MMSWSPYSSRTKHRVFVSYHHKDEHYRSEWDRLFGHLLNSTSVKPGEINDETSGEYIKRVIQKDYISQSSVVVVLVGPRTYCRKHVDWEISAGLNKKLNGYSGLIGIWLPNHSDYGKRSIDYEITPPRLGDNIKSNYAKAYDWTMDASAVTSWIEEAFNNRVDLAHRIDNTRLQFTRNICD